MYVFPVTLTALVSLFVHHGMCYSLSVFMDDFFCDAEASEASKVRAKIMDAVKRQSEQLVIAFLKAATNNERSTVDNILDEGSIEVDDSDGAIAAVTPAVLIVPHMQCCTVNLSTLVQVQAGQHFTLLLLTVTWHW